MSHRPADLYLSLHDDGPVVAAISPGRRVAALLFAVLLLMAVPLMWMSADAVATTGAKATLVDDDDDDNSGRGDGDDDDDDDRRHATNSDSATDTDDTGVSTKSRDGDQLELGDADRQDRRLDEAADRDAVQLGDADRQDRRLDEAADGTQSNRRRGPARPASRRRG